MNAGTYDFIPLRRGDTLPSTKFIFSYKPSVRTVINQADIVYGKVYQILTVGTSDFVQFGASMNVSKEIFVATSAGTGVGTGTVLLMGSQMDIASARASLVNSSGVVIYTWESPITVTHPTSGTVVLGSISPSITSEWEPELLKYDLECTLSTGEVFTMIEGSLRVIADITR